MTNEATHTQVERLKEQAIENQIDTSEIPELGEKFFQNAALTKPGDGLLDAATKCSKSVKPIR